MERITYKLPTLFFSEIIAYKLLFFYICDNLKYDKHLHIQKGLGWLLKYTYLTYPEEVEKYLRDNVSILSRTTFRYALEKINSSLLNELMKL